jgi:hypothetical protein
MPHSYIAGEEDEEDEEEEGLTSHSFYLIAGCIRPYHECQSQPRGYRG